MKKWDHKDASDWSLSYCNHIIIESGQVRGFREKIEISVIIVKKIVLNCNDS